VDHREHAAARRHQLRVVALDGGGDHQDGCRLDIALGVADEHRNAELLQALDARVLGDVAALHGIAEVVQDLGDPAHADAADSDEVDGSDVERKLSHAAALRAFEAVVAWRSTRSARRSTASGTPTPRAASAMP